MGHTQCHSLHLIWVTLGLGLSWGCTQGAGWGCGRLKAWLRLEGPRAKGPLTRLLARGFCSLTNWPLHGAAWWPYDMAVDFLQSERSQRVPGEICNAYLTWARESHAVTSTTFGLLAESHLVQPGRRGRGIRPTFRRGQPHVTCGHILQAPRWRVQPPLLHALVWHGTQ